MIEIRLSGLDGVLATLRSLPPSLVSRRGGPVLASLKAGARVILKAEQANLRAVTSNATASGKRESTGLLLKALTIKRGKAPSGGNGERVIITTKKKIYSDREGKPVSVRATAHWLEYGTESQPAEPFIRPAFNSKAREAISVIETDLLKRIKKIVITLAARNARS